MCASALSHVAVGMQGATCANCVLASKVLLLEVSASRMASPPTPASFMAAMSAADSPWWAFPPSTSWLLFFPLVPFAPHCSHSLADSAATLCTHAPTRVHCFRIPGARLQQDRCDT